MAQIPVPICNYCRNNGAPYLGHDKWHCPMLQQMAPCPNCDIKGHTESHCPRLQRIVLPHNEQAMEFIRRKLEQDLERTPLHPNQVPLVLPGNGSAPSGGSHPPPPRCRPSSSSSSSSMFGTEAADPQHPELDHFGPFVGDPRMESPTGYAVRMCLSPPKLRMSPPHQQPCCSTSSSSSTARRRLDFGSVEEVVEEEAEEDEKNSTTTSGPEH